MRSKGCLNCSRGSYLRRACNTDVQNKRPQAFVNTQHQACRLSTFSPSHPISYSREALLHLFPMEGNWKGHAAPGKKRAHSRQKNRISLSSTFTSPPLHLFHPFRALGLVFSQPLQRQPILLTAAAAPASPSLQLYSNKYRATSHPATRPCATPPAPAPFALTPTAASRGLARPRVARRSAGTAVSAAPLFQGHPRPAAGSAARRPRSPRTARWHRSPAPPSPAPRAAPPRSSPRRVEIPPRPPAPFRASPPRSARCRRSSEVPGRLRVASARGSCVTRSGCESLPLGFSGHLEPSSAVSRCCGS